MLNSTISKLGVTAMLLMLIHLPRNACAQAIGAEIQQYANSLHTSFVDIRKSDYGNVHFTLRNRSRVGVRNLRIQAAFAVADLA